jgi:hypothetical protein
VTVEELLPRLKGVRAARNGWMARCPAHEDHSPSLSICEGAQARTLLHCFAGCSVEEICAALGIRVSELFASGSERWNLNPQIVRWVQQQLITTGLRSRLTKSDRERPVTVVLADRANPEPAFARALALGVEGEIVQVAFAPERDS